jgi:hypothetical protein
MCEMVPTPHENGSPGAATAMPSDEAVDVAWQLTQLVRQDAWQLFQRAQLAQADVTIQLIVGPDGRPQRCTVGPQGDEEFRNALCSLILQRTFPDVHTGGALESQVRWDGVVPGPVLDDTHMCEMAPGPYPPPPPPPPDPATIPLPPEDAATISGAIDLLIGSQLWSQFQQLQLANVDLPVGLVVRADGTVLECSVVPAVDEALRTALCDAIRGQAFAGLQTGGAGQVNVRWDGTVPEVVPVDDWRTHMCEAAPPPYDPGDADPNRAWKRSR